MEKYSEYKDSGVHWLGEIPSHWKCLPLKRVSFVNPQGKIKVSTEQYVGYAPMEKIRCDVMTPSKIQYGKLSTGLTYCEEGDIVLAKVTPCFENGNVAIVPSVESGCCYASSELFVYRAKDSVEKRYLLYSFLNRSFIDAGASTMRGTGGLKRVTTEFAMNAPVPIPPLHEQQGIVSYLDNKCSKIDQLLVNKAKELELLAEMKQRVIADTVSRGLNPHVMLTKTGIFWQPSMPSHWTVRKLGHILQKEDRDRPQNAELLICTNKGKVVLRGDSKAGLVSESEDIYQGVTVGDLLIHGMDTWHGAIAVSEYKGMCTPVVHVCTSAEDVKFIAFYMQNMAKNKVFKLISNGVRQNTSDFRSWNKVRPIPIPLPPINEQKAIVAYIEEKVTNIDALSQKLQKEIESIKEYRQRLISDVVTGQIKVC